MADDKRKALLAEKTRLTEENLKHDEAIEKASDTLRSSKKNLAEVQQRADRQVQTTLKDYFASSSAGGLIDRILKSEMVEHRLTQVRSTITKMESTIEFSRSEKRKNNQLISQIDRQLDEIDLEESAKSAVFALRGLIETATTLQEPYTKLVTERARTMEMANRLGGKNWTQRLKDAGLEAHELLMLDSIMTACVTSNPLELCFKIAVHSDMNGKNPLHSTELRKLERGIGNVYTRRFDRYAADHIESPGSGSEAVVDAISEAILDLG